MRHSWFVPVLLALAALAGYAVGARPAQAQSEPLPFRIGEIVTFRYPDNGSRDCRIAEVKGIFALCGPTSERQGPTYGRAVPAEEWINIAVAERVTRPTERK